jgi:hypothetical protein
MDSIDHIAAVFQSDCVRVLKIFSEINTIIETSDTINTAHGRLRHKGYACYVDIERLDLVSYELDRYGRCLESIDEAKTLARRVFAVSFKDSDIFNAFHREISFSYACKMLSGVGPSLGHFSGTPTVNEVMNLELKLACETPFLALQAYSDLLCLESMSAGCGTCSLGFNDEGERENFILEDIRRSAQPVPLTSYVKRRRVKGTESPSACPPVSTIAVSEAALSPGSLLVCDETITPFML